MSIQLCCFFKLSVTGNSKAIMAKSKAIIKHNLLQKPDVTITMKLQHLQVKDKSKRKKNN